MSKYVSIAHHRYRPLSRGAVGFEQQVIDAAGYGVASEVAAVPQHGVVLLISVVDEGIFPTQVGETGEVGVGRAKGQTVLNGECSEMSVGYVVST